MNGWEAFGLGIAGGLTSEMHALYRYRKHALARRPDWIRSPFYWFSTLPIVLAGGGVVSLYLASGVAISPVMALHLGLATPSLIGAFTTMAD
ncbi:hypothetical protein [Pseudoxanthomonas indica]|uniref:hypothetical protein n=1 Tax=Pseudoxanthomonas indica TaxID=428993 RepID=UPI0009A65ED5|nr:hypothetical protein [Pseudoxanthomonas indica]GGD38124.1 hypothetical protein GCM10007235_07900 [Pseudoxanthomonas indica]